MNPSATRRVLIPILTMILAAGPSLQVVILAQSPPANSPLGDEAVAKDRAGAMAGDVESMIRLGWRYVQRQGSSLAGLRPGSTTIHVTGVAQDDKAAVAWFQKAAATGHTTAMTYLGLMHEWGKGVKRDDAEAARLYRRAAEAGVKQAQTYLGAMYLVGRGVPQDEALALKWLTAAGTRSKDGLGGEPDHRAMTYLGLMYLEGTGVAKNDEDALYYLTLSGDLMAGYYKGLLHATGMAGVKKDLVLARDFIGRIASFSRAGNLDPFGGGLFSLGHGIPLQMQKSAIELERDIEATLHPARLSALEGGFVALLLFTLGLAILAPGGDTGASPSVTSELERIRARDRERERERKKWQMDCAIAFDSVLCH